MQNMSVARRRRDRTDSAEYSDASYEDDNHINSGDEDEGDSEYDSAEHSVSDDLSERESGDGQAAPGSQKGERVDHDEDRRNPQYIPKRGTFYEHDDRTAPGEEEGEATEEKDSSVNKGSGAGGDVIMTSGTTRERTGGAPGTPAGGPERKPRQSRANAADKWTHDKFDENDQAPKSSEELVSIYGYDIRAEEGPPRAFRRRKYGRGPNKYTRNWEDEQAYTAKTTPARVKAPPQVTNGEEFPSLQSSSESTSERLSSITHIINQPPDECPKEKVTVATNVKARTEKVGFVPPGSFWRPYHDKQDILIFGAQNKGDRRRNGTTHDVPKKTIEVIPPKKQETDKNANNTKATQPHSTPSDHHNTGTVAPKHTPTEKAILPKQRTAGTGRVGFVPPGPLRRPYAENKDISSPSAQKETPSIQKNSVPPSAGLPSASLGGTQERKSPSVRKPNTASIPPRMQHSQQVAAQQSPQPTAVPPSQQLQQIPSTVNTVNNNAVNTTSARASPPQQIANVQTQLSPQVTTEVASGRGKRYSSIRQRPMPDQYQPVQYITDYQPPPPQTQQPAPTQQQQQQIPTTIPTLPHRQTPPPSLQQSQQQQLLTQQNQQLLQTQQLQQQIHQKTPPPQLHQQTTILQTNQSMQQMMQPTQGIHQTNPNIIQSTQHTQSLHQTTSSLHQQPSQSMHQINPSMQQMHQASPTLHQTNTPVPVHQSNAPMLQSNPQMLQTNPPIHQASPSIHQSNPPMLQSTASLHPATSSMIQTQQIHQQSTTLHQPNASLHQTNPSIHQASPTLHQSNPSLHQSSQPILQNNPPLHQVSPPLQTQMGRQGTAPAVSTIPMRQVQRSHQQIPIHNMPAPTHLQGSLPQQGLVGTQTYPAQPMIPQTQYIQNNSSGMFSHNIPPQVYQTQQGYAAPPPPIPYHHQPTPPYVNPARSVYREPSGITFYSPQEQKGATAPPPTRRPTNAIPIVPPPSRRDRERLSDAAAVQKDNIDHIVDNMFVPRHQQPRNAAPRPGDVTKTVEPVTSQSEPGSEEKSKDGSGDKSSKETSVEPTSLPSPTVTEAPAIIESPVVETLASEVRDKLSLEVNAELEQLQVEQEDISAEYVDCEQQITQDVEECVQAPCETDEILPPVEETVVYLQQTVETAAATTVSDVSEDVSVQCEAPSEDVVVEEPIQSTEQVKDEKEPSGIQVTSVAEEQTAAVVEIEPTVEEEKIDTPKDVPEAEPVETLDVVQEPAEALPTEAVE